MNRFSKILLTLCAAVIPALLSAASFNVGCFNVRYQTAIDQGETNWDSRKPYVARTIIDNFDIVGLNEMNNLGMQDYIQANIPGFTLTVTGIWEGMNPNIHQCHAIIYRTEMFDKLDEGHFWLNTDPTKPGVSWDCSPNTRMTHWTLMRVKETGEEFYFFITHLDHLGDDARNEQALMNFERVREIAGDKPVILTGDHNSAKSRYPFYNLMSSYMQDARVVSAEPFPWKNDGTLCKWDPENTTGTRIDYIWARGFRVNTYRHINETYGRSVTPSDHFPIVANVTISPVKGLYECYVRPDGRSGGNGSIQAPFQTLDEALDAVADGGIINVTAGEYNLSDVDLTKSVSIRGGWNKAFSDVVGKSIIDARGNRLFTVSSNAYIELSGMLIRNASSTATGAAVNCAGPRVVLDNCAFEDCSSTKNGGAVYAAQQVFATGTSFTRCSSNNYGGAVFTNYQSTKLWWRYQFYNCRFEQCQAVRGSAIYLTGYSRANINGCTFVGNHASYVATVALNASSFDSHTSVVNCTFVNNSVISNAGAMNSLKGASAILVNVKSDSPVAIANNTVIFNTEMCGDDSQAPEDYAGAAVYVLSGQLMLNNNIIAANTSNAFDAVSDVRGEVSGDANNIFTSPATVSFKPTTTDITSGSLADARARLREMYLCDEAGNPLITNIKGYEDAPASLLLLAPSYGAEDIRRVDANHLVEELTMVDYDNDAQCVGRIWGDQLGRERDLKGKATIGSVEYRQGDAAGVESIDADPASPSLSYEILGNRVISTAPGTIAMYDISGRTLAVSITGTLDIALAPGVYILAYQSISFKIYIK